MTSKQKYTYTILRYVHDVVAGEFVNVGVVMHAPAINFVRIEVRTSVGRIKSLFPDMDRAAFVAAVKAAKRSVDKIGESLVHGDLLAEFSDVISIAHRVLAPDDSSLQWSPISSGLTENPDKAFARIYGRYITRYDGKSTHRRSDDEVWRPVRSLLEARNISVEFDKKTVSGKSDEIVFKHAWRNGIWHAYEPLSFDLADAEGIKDKARRWRGHLEAVHDGRECDLKLHFVVGAPQNPSLMPAYKSALGILENAAFEPAIYREDEVSRLVAEIEADLKQHAVEER